MSQRDAPSPLPPELVQARLDAWASLVDMAIEGMVAMQKRLHPDRDPWPYVREAIRRQGEESHQANIRMLERVASRGK